MVVVVVGTCTGRTLDEVEVGREKSGEKSPEAKECAFLHYYYSVIKRHSVEIHTSGGLRTYYTPFRLEKAGLLAFGMCKKCQINKCQCLF